ncbi:hypothetical protein CEUSTIGMA_g10804.t1 [Chlamydomonas eustigma]|uniref:SUI1 domain-containing protein n=1 Tax=Chlamydomonas eustigma TaxID=1157962 RepID=A0A250XKC2_9CHLO|nr:hypothetical protein CEUSTIGMA_g10804.t1 [Chlamydomonas eustigma]|eukprot:GAX83379.1 hypothetical protein CEUSTIGMA_g10804.t1 [Chlamydomonas eustigma]
MAEDAECSTSAVVTPPVFVEYCPITGLPPEYNECLPKESDEYKKWKASQEGPEGLEKLTLRDKDGNEVEKKLPGGKVKKKAKPQIIMETAKRQGKKMTTSIAGLENFGIKLSDASKVFGKKFACGASVTKTASLTEQIEMQGEFMDKLPDLILKTYGSSHNITKDDIFFIG